MRNTDTTIFIKQQLIGNIQFIDQTKNKTKNITVSGYHLKNNIASKGRYKTNKINKVIIILESEAKNHVINNYLKMKIPILWRKFFKKLLKIEIIYIIIVLIHI